MNKIIELVNYILEGNFIIFCYCIIKVVIIVEGGDIVAGSVDDGKLCIIRVEVYIIYNIGEFSMSI